MKKGILIVALAVLVALFFYFDLQQWLSLDALKGSMDRLQALVAENPLVFAGAFLLVYIAATALSLPGAAILTLAAGALFGVLWGTVIVSFASSIGATLAFLVSRYLLRDSVRDKFGKRLETIDKGIEKEGAFYLFTLRLVPAFPFFLINLLMGLTNIKAWTFYWVSQIGMFAGTIVFVNAGTQLAQIDSLSGILSPALILSFVVLGVFPLIAKKIVDTVKAQRVYKGYNKPKKFDRNLVVIGAGAGGLVSSYIAAAVKAKVTLIEAGKMGGDCLNYGCVPSKAIIRSARVAHEMKNAENFGFHNTEPNFSFKSVMARVHNIIAQIEPHDSVERYTKLGVEVLQGYAKIIDPWTVDIQLNDGTSQRLTSRSIVLATGARPYVPDIPGIETSGYVTSDTLWDTFAKLEELPERLVVMGGGPIGSELAQAFARLGSKVTQVERGERILKREDEDVSEFSEASLKSSGVEILTQHTAIRFEQNNDQRSIVLKSPEDKEITLAYHAVICAVGREARLEGYGLEELGIEAGRTIDTNDFLQTKFPNIYAVGDVAGPFQFTHTAAHQAWYAAVNALFGQFKKFKADYRVIPWTTFIDPEVARVGINEQEAISQGIDYEVTRFDLAELDRAITESAAHGFIKVITPKGKDNILGVTIVGEHGGDLLAEFVLAMKHGLGLNKILGTIHTYPTWSEATKYAAGEWKRAHAPEGVLQWVKKYHSWRLGK